MTYYNRGMKYFEAKDYFRALEEFNSATSLEFEDKKQKRTYGTRFIKYLPHFYIGQCYYYLGEADNAQRELELSIAYVKNKETIKFLEKITGGGKPQAGVDTFADKEETFTDKKEDKKLNRRQKALEQQRKKKERHQPVEEFQLSETELERLENERKGIEEKRRKKLEAEKVESLQRQAVKDEDLVKQPKEEIERQEELKRKIEELQRQIKEDQIRQDIERRLATQGKQLPDGALTYDPNRVTRVGSRLTVAVMPFHVAGSQESMSEHITETMITQLVKLHRFRILERNALQKIMKEHSLSVSGVIEESTAIELGKLASADAIILGNVIISSGYSKFNARIIDTETAVTIIAQDSDTQSDLLEDITEEVKKLAIKIYNDMPLVEGYVVNVDGDQVYLDLGLESSVRRGTKVVVYREGNPIIHPVNGEVLGKKIIQIGEMIVVQSQEKFSVARLLNCKEQINAGDKFVVK